MDRTSVAETGGFAAIAGGLGSAVALPDALPGLSHRYGGHVTMALLAGREIVCADYRGCSSGAVQGLEGQTMQASRGLLAVAGRGASARSAAPLAHGLVAEQAVAACLTGVVHNGPALRDALVQRGALFGDTGQAEILLQLMAQSRQRTLVNRLVEALERMVGGFSLVLITDELAVAARDPRGFRPLWIGARADGHAVASDPSALAALGALELRELAAGEVVLLEPGAPVRSLRPWGVFPRAACAMEWLGRGRAGSSFEGLSNYTVRDRLGRALAATCPAPGDVVVALPGACAVAGQAFAQQARIAFGTAFEPLVTLPGAPASAPELHVVEAAVRNRSLVLVFAPETPSELLHEAVGALRRAGARQVHLRCFGPLQAAECPYGLRLPSPAVAPGVGIEPQSLDVWLRADSLEVTTLAGLTTALGREATGSCALCLGGPAPLQARDAAATPQLPLFEGGGSGIEDARLV